MKNSLLSLAGLAAGLLLSGCVTSGTNAQLDVQNQTRQAIDRNTTASLAVGMGIVSGQTGPIEAAAAKLGEDVNLADKHYEELRKELEKQKLEFSNFVNGAISIVGQVATDLVPGGTTAANVLRVLKTNIDAAQTSANKAQQDSQAALTEAKGRIAELEKQVAEKDKALGERIDAEKTRLESEQALAKKELALLTAEQVAKLRPELVALAKEHGVADADGMSTEELLAALGATGIGLAGLLRTFGKSRSQGEIDQLWDRVEDVQKDVAKVEGKVSPS